jgi:hypothetical protein
MKRIEHTCAQGSAEWFGLRIGKPTASQITNVVTSQGKATASAARQSYLADLVLERITGKIKEVFVTDAMKRGVALEPRARAWYSMTTGRDVRQVGFVERDDFAGKFGASPDGLCEDRGLEIKALTPANHISALISGEPSRDHVMQCQFGMFCTGLELWELCYFTDAAGVPNRVWTLAADERVQAAFAEHVPAFCAEVDAAVASLVASGAVIQTPESPVGVEDAPMPFGD